MKQSNAIAYLRQLCCSGLPKEIVIPEFLRAVQQVLPSGNNTFTGVDERFFPTYHLLGFDPVELDENTPVIVAGYFTPQRLNLAAAYFKQQPVMPGWEVLDESLFKSDFYNLVCRPLGQYHSLYAPVMQDGKPVGMLNLFRPRQQKPFNSREQALCVQLLPYIAHALHAPVDTNIQYGEHGVSGMMVLDTQGQFVYLSPEAKHLLALACHPLLAVDAGQQTEALLGKVAQVCRNLDTIFRGQHAVPPVWSHIGNNGQFKFRAYWLDKHNNEPGGLVGMTIEHLEPMLLKLLRALQHTPLSPAQKEVAIMLAQGFSSDRIGEYLHIKLYTVKDHISKIFTKLDINHREELLPKLLVLNNPNQPNKSC